MSEKGAQAARPADSQGDRGDVTAGGLLRAARERQGVQLAMLATAMKVPQRKLELLEADRIDELPDPSFTRALALSLCRSLKIEPEPVLARLPRAGADELAQVTLGLNAPFKDRSAGGSALEWRRFANLPMLAGLVLVLGAVAVYWLPLSIWPKLGGDAATRVATITSTPPTAASPSATIEGGTVTEPGAATAAAATAASAAGLAAPGVVETVFSAPAEPASVPVAGGMLMLRAASESWVEVRDAAGRVLLSRSLAPGEAAGLDGALPLRVVVGNAEATQVTFRGQPVALAASRDNVARLELK